MELKKHLYISIFSLIVFVSLALLNNYSTQCSGSITEKQYLEIRKVSTEKWSMKDVTDDNPRITGNQSARTTFFEGVPVQKEMNLTGLVPGKHLSDPTLFDLPPPALQMLTYS